MAGFAAEREPTNGLGNPGGACPGTIETNVGWDEAIDKDLNKLDRAGGLNPDCLVRDPTSVRCRCLTSAESDPQPPRPLLSGRRVSLTPKSSRKQSVSLKKHQT
jgi:hypothetical protein